jgi:hypothetical protein
VRWILLDAGTNEAAEDWYKQGRTGMSSIIWKNSLRAPQNQVQQSNVYDLYQGGLCVHGAETLPAQAEEIVDLPDSRSYRALSRAGILLAAAGLKGRAALAPFLADDPFSVGMYCAMEVGPNDYNSARQMVDAAPDKFAAMYKGLRSSKQYFKQLANVPPSQLGIFLGIMGPQSVFSHSRWGCLHALEQAEFDLNEGSIQAALVCSAFSLEDPLLSMRVRRTCEPERSVGEAGAAIILACNGEYTDWRSVIGREDSPTYGIAHDLVMLATDDEQEPELLMEAAHAGQ